MHYSPFALDLYWAARGPDRELEAHVAGCAQCRGYLDHLGGLATPIALPVARKRSWFPALAAAIVAIAIIFIVWPRKPIITDKGEPTVQLLVHRGTDTVVWDAAMPVRARDALALRLACDGMTEISVLVPDHGGWQVAFEGSCQDGVLPFTLVVDDQPGAEQIAIVLARTQLDAAAAQRAAELTTRSAALWTTHFQLSKETP